MENNRFEIRFSGSGGQGIIMAAVIFAEAAGVYNCKYVCQTQSYGPEARGGTSKAEIVISDSPIDYPKSLEPNILLAMNQESCDKYFRSLRDDGLLIVDSTFVEQIPTERVVSIPFTRIARNKLGNELVANTVALGAVAGISNIITQKNIEKSLKKRAPAEMLEINLKAARAGLKTAREVNIDMLPKFITPEDEEV